jgi:hypothetical protein
MHSQEIDTPAKAGVQGTIGNQGAVAEFGFSPPTSFQRKRESRFSNEFWIPAFAGVTGFRSFATASQGIGIPASARMATNGVCRFFSGQPLSTIIKKRTTSPKITYFSLFNCFPKVLIFQGNGLFPGKRSEGAFSSQH